MKYVIQCVIAGSLALAGSAGARLPATGSTQATPDNPAKETRVCRERMRTGSHLSNVVCKTPEQWAQLQADFDDQAEYGFPGVKVSTGREFKRGGGGPPR